MEDAMVTGRMSQQKKTEGNAVLARAGIKPSQAVNLLYDRLIESQDAGFLRAKTSPPSLDEWRRASQGIDALVLPWTIDQKFENMSNRQVALDRLARKGDL